MKSLNLPGADIRIDETFIPEFLADGLFEDLLETLPWNQGYINIRGNQIPEPRLTSAHGDGKSYRYSGKTMHSNPWTRDLLSIREKLAEQTDAYFNFVLANLYRVGKRDSIGMHSDDEPELGYQPVIASVSLGTSRIFILKSKLDGQEVKLELPHGSLLIMQGDTQQNWQHGIAKETQPSLATRINLTFRNIIN